jgi:hypothetical protein
MVQYLLGRAVASWMDAFSSPLTFPPSRVGRAGLFCSSGATDSGLWAYVRFALGSDRTANIPDRQLRADFVAEVG